MNTTTKKEKIKFSKAFWVANTVELFERAAYYGVFIVITLYLSRIPRIQRHTSGNYRRNILRIPLLPPDFCRCTGR